MSVDPRKDKWDPVVECEAGSPVMEICEREQLVARQRRRQDTRKERQESALSSEGALEEKKYRRKNQRAGCLGAS
jgi:hypothetical protein